MPFATPTRADDLGGTLPTGTRVRHPLALFFALAYGISWLLWAPLWLPALGVEGLPVLPFHHALGALGPITAAFAVATMEGGRAGGADLLRRMVLWRGRLGWVLVAMLGPYALLTLGSVGAALFTGIPLSLVGLGAAHASFGPT